MHGREECTKCTHNIGEVRRGQFNAGGLSGFLFTTYQTEYGRNIIITSMMIMMICITFSLRINDNRDSIRTMIKV